MRTDCEHERLFRFEFPERPGALLRFLEAIGAHWNISLFHYRNHGSDYGRVLAGVQVPPADGDEFAQHLAELQYGYTEETQNPAYRMFLGDKYDASRGPGRRSPGRVWVECADPAPGPDCLHRCSTIVGRHEANSHAFDHAAFPSVGRRAGRP